MITFSLDTLQPIPIGLFLNNATQIANKSHQSPSFYQIHRLLFDSHLPDSRQLDTVHTCLLLKVILFWPQRHRLPDFPPTSRTVPSQSPNIGTHRAQSSPLLTLFHQPQRSFLHANFVLSLPCLKPSAMAPQCTFKILNPIIAETP